MRVSRRWWPTSTAKCAGAAGGAQTPTGEQSHVLAADGRPPGHVTAGAGVGCEREGGGSTGGGTGTGPGPGGGGGGGGR